MDINTQIKNLEKEIEELNQKQQNEYKIIFDKYVKNINRKKKNLEDLKTEYFITSDFSHLSFKTFYNSNNNNVCYELVDPSEKDKKFFFNLNKEYHFSEGDDILRVFVNDHDIHFTSKDIKAAQERHKFKIDNSELNSIIESLEKQLNHLKTF